MTLPNALICFTNCLLPMEDGCLVEKDLWIDGRRGIVLDSQVREEWPVRSPYNNISYDVGNVLLDEAATRYSH